MKSIKQKFFSSNYKKELVKPKNAMASVAFQNEGVSGTKYFEMKYFLTDLQKRENFIENSIAQAFNTKDNNCKKHDTNEKEKCEIIDQNLS